MSVVFLTDAEKKHFRLVSGQLNLDGSLRETLGEKPPSLQIASKHRVPFLL